MSEKTRKSLYCLFKVLSVLIACAFPVWAIYEKFPVWETTHGKTHSLGVGAILAVIVLIIIFRTSVFNFLKEKLKLNHAPPLLVWLIMIAVSYVLIFIGKFMQDVVTVLWMGLVGCSIGTFLTFVAENKFGKKKEDGDGQS